MWVQKVESRNTGRCRPPGEVRGGWESALDDLKKVFA